MFFGQKLLLQWTEHPDGDWTKPEYVRQRIIDDTIGAGFDLQLVDLDGDGVDELLVTNHQDGKNGAKPSVYAYEIKSPILKTQTRFGPHMTGSESPVTQFMEQLRFERYVRVFST